MRAFCSRAECDDCHITSRNDESRVQGELHTAHEAYVLAPSGTPDAGAARAGLARECRPWSAFVVRSVARGRSLAAGNEAKPFFVRLFFTFVPFSVLVPKYQRRTRAAAAVSVPTSDRHRLRRIAGVHVDEGETADRIGRCLRCRGGLPPNPADWRAFALRQCPPQLLATWRSCPESSSGRVTGTMIFAHWPRSGLPHRRRRAGTKRRSAGSPPAVHRNVSLRRSRSWSSRSARLARAPPP